MSQVYQKATGHIGCERAELSLRRYPRSEAADKSGIARDAFYLVGPDGYVGLAAASDAPAALRDYQARFNLAFGRGHDEIAEPTERTE
jgi:hypothetical protein